MNDINIIEIRKSERKSSDFAVSKIY